MLSHMQTADSVSKFEGDVNTAEEALKILLRYAPPEKKSPLASFISDKREISAEEYGRLAEKETLYLGYCLELVSLNKKIGESEAAVARTELALDALKPWLTLDVPMRFSGTAQAKCFIGTLPGRWTREEILEDIDPQLELFDAGIVSIYKEQTCVSVLCHKDVESEVYQALRDINFVQLTNSLEETPALAAGRLKGELIRYKEEIENTIAAIKSYADRRGDIEFFIDYLTVRRDKYAALGNVGVTKNAFIITGYIPEKFANKCVAEIANDFGAAVSLSELDSSEEAPILLENNRFSSPMEPIAAMFSLPSARDVDPSPVMAFFYYLLFGMMLSDAGYGVIMTIVSAIALKKTNLKESLRKTFRMFFYCGISTIFWGALFGSWFGDIVQVVAKQFFNYNISSTALWFDPITDPVTLLLLSFLLGIAHLLLGQCTKFYMLWRDGKKIDAILDVVPTCLLMIGSIPLGGSVLTEISPIFMTVGSYTALTGVALIVLTASRSSKNIFARLGGGLYSLYNTAAGCLGDVLSYSRLLALGLATGSIGGVINMMGSVPENPVVKAIVLTVVFVVAHPLNMAVNLLGAYVHTNRLQFVELFSKFYEGGGRAFAPLKVNTQYIQIKTEGKRV